jgi:hypothetical protein
MHQHAVSAQAVESSHPEPNEDVPAETCIVIRLYASHSASQPSFARSHHIAEELGEFAIDHCLRVMQHDLLQMELILFDLRDHIEEGDEVDYFVLEGIEATDAQNVQIIRPFGTWNKIVKRRDGQRVPKAAMEEIFIATKSPPRGKRATRGRRKAR